MKNIKRLFWPRRGVRAAAVSAEGAAEPAVVTISHHGSSIGLRPEFEERYRILHRNVFPGVLDRIRKCNIRNYSIFLAGRTLFGHYEYVGREYRNDMEAMADPVTKDWWKLTEPMQTPVKGRKRGEWWATMSLLAHSGGEVRSGAAVRRGAARAHVGRGGGERGRKLLEVHRPALVTALRRHGFQNVSAYYFGGWIYLYFEQVAEEPSTAVASLLGEEVMGAVRRELRPFGPGGGARGGKELAWESMEEVFHTE